MARTTKSVSRARTADQGASKKGTGKRAVTRGRSAERGAMKRGAAKKGAPKRRDLVPHSRSKAGRLTLSLGSHSSLRRML